MQIAHGPQVALPQPGRDLLLIAGTLFLLQDLLRFVEGEARGELTRGKDCFELGDPPGCEEPILLRGDLRRTGSLFGFTPTNYMNNTKRQMYTN